MLKPDVLIQDIQSSFCRNQTQPANDNYTVHRLKCSCFEELCSLIIDGCQKLSVTTNNVKSPKNFKVQFKKKNSDFQCCTLEDLDDSLNNNNKNSIYTSSELYIKTNISSQLYKSCYYSHGNIRQSQNLAARSAK